ncbi:hypothetical protein ILYODFUR_038305 [Ilyodon furcidens]|uniref:Uncharacterized protein n=1 Tax=Ilyodon furcidens TaxID=33524 RepID=A0ABV0U2G5_9TELE
MHQDNYSKYFASSGPRQLSLIVGAMISAFSKTSCLVTASCGTTKEAITFFTSSNTQKKPVREQIQRCFMLGPTAMDFNIKLRYGPFWNFQNKVLTADFL